MFAINYFSPWKFGPIVPEIPISKYQDKLQEINDVVEFGYPDEWLEIHNFQVVGNLEHLLTGALFRLHIGFDAMVEQHREGFSFMNYFVSMEPLNQAAKDFQKHPEVRELVPDTDPSWNGDALSSYSAPYHTWIQLANGMEDREYRAKPIIDFSKRWNIPLQPLDLRKIWHDFVDLSKYPNLELEANLSHPTQNPRSQGLTHYFKVAAAHK